MDEHASDLEASSHSQQSAGSGVSAAQIGAQTSESPLPFAVPVEGRTRGTGLKSYTYLPPRIDAERFQADIPAFAGPEAGPQAQNAAAAKTEAAADVDRSLALGKRRNHAPRPFVLCVLGRRLVLLLLPCERRGVGLHGEHG